MSEQVQYPAERDEAAVTKTRRRELLRTIQSEQADINRSQARQLAAIAEFARLAGESADVPLELSLGLAIGKRTAQRRIKLATALTTRLPRTLEAMRRGEIDSRKAVSVHEPTTVLSDEQAREVDAIIVTRIQGKDPTGVRRSTNLAVAKVDPGGYAQRCAKRRARRKVELIPLHDGTVKLSARLPVEDGSAAYARIDTDARRRRRRDTSKTLDQHRADACTDLLLKDDYGVRAGPRAEVFVYLDFATWLGLNNEPAEMAGQGLIPAWLARHIANGENTTLRRLITDPETGQIISVGRNRYRPPADLARLIHVRDRECRIATCHRPSQACETDHVDDWYAKNGETADDNLAALCARDHHAKDLPGWAYELDKETGRLTVTAPTGDRYTSDPEPLHPPRANTVPEERLAS